MSFRTRSAAAAFEAGLAALDSGVEDVALPHLLVALELDPENPRLWQVTGLLYRAMQDLGPAMDAFEEAHRLAPKDRLIAFGLAQARFEAGLPSLDEFDAAMRIAPGDLEILRACVAAKARDQGPDAAIRDLDPVLQMNPLWIAGHQTMARLRTAAADEENIDASFVEAARAHRGHSPLWQCWASTLFEANRYADALCVINEGRSHLPFGSLDLLEAAALSEDCQLLRATSAFARLPAAQTADDLLFPIRHMLRIGHADQVTALGHRLISAPDAAVLVPLFAAAWRVTNDSRIAWLEPPELIAAFDLKQDLPDLAELAETLRQIHQRSSQPLGQSVRGGTQTDGPLLSRVDPKIRVLRRAIEKAVRHYLSAMPPRDAAHPTLRHPRHRPIRFAGSWSVRLCANGFHDAHVHPQGWLSSALHITVPQRDGIDGKDQAGALAIGEPQKSLGLDRQPLQIIAPCPGRLILFPSTTWHGTLPFEGDERMTVAFDVAFPT